MIVKVDGKQDGHRHFFYNLTNTGLSHLIKSGLDARDFFETLVKVYNKNSLHVTISIDEIWLEYEKNNMPVSDDHIPLTFHNFLPEFDSGIEVYPVLTEIAKVGPLTKTQLSNKVGFKTSKEKSVIEKMLNTMIIVHSEFQKTKLKLSPIGVLMILNPSRVTNDGYTYITYTEEEYQLLDKLTREYRKLLPMIFNYWNELVKIQDKNTLIKNITSFMTTDPFLALSDPIRDNNYRMISDILIMMERSHADYCENVIISCINALKKILGFPQDKSTVQKIHRWIHADKSKEPSIRSELKPRFDILRKCIEIIEKKEVFLRYDSKSKSLLEEIGLYPDLEFRKKELEPIATNVITFLFYTMFRQRFKEKEFMKSLIPSSLKGSDHSKTRDVNKKWRDFLKGNPDLILWYNDWLDEIVKFQRKNVEQISQIRLENIF